MARWRPRNHTDVVLDPTRHFGDPILDEFGISTGTIYKEFGDFNDTNYLSKIYEVQEKLIRRCIRFERMLDKAHG